MKANKSYIVTDLQDLSDRHDFTLEEARQFLANIWDNTIDGESEEGEVDKHIANILQADYKLLGRYLEGIGYTIFEGEKDYVEFKSGMEE